MPFFLRGLETRFIATIAPTAAHGPRTGSFLCVSERKRSFVFSGQDSIYFLSFLFMGNELVRGAENSGVSNCWLISDLASWQLGPSGDGKKALGSLLSTPVN
jgi:hypothetical protein